MSKREFKPGTYRHYSGKKYDAIGVARHSEAPDEKLVVYLSLYDDGMWARPYDMFMEEIDHEGLRQLRFEKIKDTLPRWKVRVQIEAGQGLEFIQAANVSIEASGSLIFLDATHDVVKCYAPGAWVSYEPWPFFAEVKDAKDS